MEAVARVLAPPLTDNDAIDSKQLEYSNKTVTYPNRAVHAHNVIYIYTCVYIYPPNFCFHYLFSNNC